MDPSPPILTEDELKAAIRELFKRARTDWEFRQRCLADAAAAIREISGKALPADFVLQFKDMQQPAP